MGLEIMSDLMLNKVLSKSPGKSPLVKGPSILWKAHQGYQLMVLNMAPLFDKFYEPKVPCLAPDLLILLLSLITP